jgi:hypothetical protein
MRALFYYSNGKIQRTYIIYISYAEQKFIFFLSVLKAVFCKLISFLITFRDTRVVQGRGIAPVPEQSNYTRREITDRIDDCLAVRAWPKSAAVGSGHRVDVSRLGFT